MGYGVRIRAFLLTCAVGVMLWQTAVWRSARGKEGQSEEERRYMWRRYRRRMQTGVLMALIAVMLPVADWAVRPREAPQPAEAQLGVAADADADADRAHSPRLGAATVGLMLALIGWIVALTAADLWATKVYFGRLRDATSWNKCGSRPNCAACRPSARQDPTAAQTPPPTNRSDAHSPCTSRYCPA